MASMATPMPQNPRIAGMPERYVADQLHLFKSGQRTSGMAAIMAPFAGILSAQDMRDVGAWYASQKAGAGVADDTAIADGPNKGMKFYQVGETPVPQRRSRPRPAGLHGLPRPDRRRQPGPGLPALCTARMRHT